MDNQLSGKTEIQRRKTIIIYLKVAAILFISSIPGWFVCDILGYIRLGVLVFVVFVISLMFPFGFLKIRRI